MTRQFLEPSAPSAAASASGDAPATPSAAASTPTSASTSAAPATPSSALTPTDAKAEAPLSPSVAGTSSAAVLDRSCAVLCRAVLFGRVHINQFDFLVLCCGVVWFSLSSAMDWECGACHKRVALSQCYVLDALDGRSDAHTVCRACLHSRVQTHIAQKQASELLQSFSLQDLKARHTFAPVLLNRATNDVCRCSLCVGFGFERSVSVDSG